MSYPRLRRFALLFALAPVLLGGVVPGRYIVELTTEPVADHVAAARNRQALQTGAARDHRARVRAEQDRVQGDLERRRARVLDRVDTVANALFVEADEASAAALASAPGVKRVLPVRLFRLLLDHAVLVHKVAEAWNQVGLDHAGEGIRIAIIDSGIEATHPGFQNSGLTAPDGFPRTNYSADVANTNGKIIVARSYVALLQYPDPDYSARDHVGHGTALAMIAAGARTAAPLATLTGVAPRAWVGNYKIFGTPGYNDYATDAAILKAIDDAVADGMDIINLSLGDDLAPRLADDIDVQAVERATRAGVIVVAAAGNSGPDMNTMSSPGTSPSAISVGALTNERTFGAAVEAAGMNAVLALPGTGPTPSGPVTASLADVAVLDSNGQACNSLPKSSLSGRIALILRGNCTFESKLNNAQAAGAVGAVVYAADSSPAPITMSVGLATLPAEMISNSDGVALKNMLAVQPALSVTMRFTLGAVAAPGGRLTDFTAAGPNVDLGIKPDVMAVGQNFYTATETLDSRGDMYDSSGFILVDGTSFSTPFTAGSAALLKAARPGLTVDQYRSLLINAASTALDASGNNASIQQSGAGSLNVQAALASTLTANPVSVSFGAGNGTLGVQRSITLTNISQVPDSITMSVDARSGSAPGTTTMAIQLGPGGSVDMPVWWFDSGLAPGPYQGYFVATSAANGSTIRIPYWYASTSAVPAGIKVFSAVSTARRGALTQDAVLFRVTDASGVPILNGPVTVSAPNGGGTATLVNHDADVPGLFGMNIQAGVAAGNFVFRIQAGDLTSDVTITVR